MKCTRNRVLAAAALAVFAGVPLAQSALADEYTTVTRTTRTYNEPFMVETTPVVTAPIARPYVTERVIESPVVIQDSIPAQTSLYMGGTERRVIVRDNWDRRHLLDLDLNPITRFTMF